MRVLIAEDDTGLRSVIERGLEENGYVVDAVPDGETAERYFAAYDYDVAVLDWRMPGRDGLELVRQLRRRGNRTPLLMLTARDATADRITGLNGGADDYLVKPFDFGELLARLHALQRRPALTTGPVLQCADLAFDPATRQTTVDGRPVPLTSTETTLLEILLRRSPAVVTRRTLAIQGWENEADAVGSNTIEVHIGRLRGKLGRSRAQIATVRGSGYRLVPS
ncbi:MAG TPA: response regulator transcription factor [Acidimicrobiales bacterium]|nr:response regulator transcription factor [Acidimicrobiales bacterium]